MFLRVDPGADMLISSRIERVVRFIVVFTSLIIFVMLHDYTSHCKSSEYAYKSADKYICTGGQAVWDHLIIGY